MQVWLNEIDSYEDTEANLTLKNDYIYFILLMLQNNKIEDYFRESPPKTLLPLKKVLVNFVARQLAICNVFKFFSQKQSLTRS